MSEGFACELDDDAACRSWGPELRRARRSHRCIECGRWIRPGELYQWCAQIYERGDPVDVYKTCVECAEVRFDTVDEDGCVPIWGELHVALCWRDPKPKRAALRTSTAERAQGPAHLDNVVAFPRSPA